MITPLFLAYTAWELIRRRSVTSHYILVSSNTFLHWYYSHNNSLSHHTTHWQAVIHSYTNITHITTVIAAAPGEKTYRLWSVQCRQIPRHTWSLPNQLPTCQHPCLANLCRWSLVAKSVVLEGDQIVDMRPLTKSEGSLVSFHETEDNARYWLATMPCNYIKWSKHYSTANCSRLLSFYSNQWISTIRFLCWGKHSTTYL